MHKKLAPKEDSTAALSSPRVKVAHGGVEWDGWCRNMSPFKFKTDNFSGAENAERGRPLPRMGLMANITYGPHGGGGRGPIGSSWHAGMPAHSLLGRSVGPAPVSSCLEDDETRALTGCVFIRMHKSHSPPPALSR